MKASRLKSIKKAILKNTLEFIVIVLGISISFYLEKQNTFAHKETVKNQSLNRILNNFKDDQIDYTYNLEAHKGAVKSCQWIVKNQHNLSHFSKDSVGYHLGYAIYTNTRFRDNQEEYRGLQNSGLIELIENGKVVSGLQKKYMMHAVYKSAENNISNLTETISDFMYINTKFKSGKTNQLGYNADRTYVGDNNIPHLIIQKIQEKKFMHQYYLKNLKERVAADKELIKLIMNEIEK